MKKLLSNIGNSTAQAVNNAVKQIDRTLDKTLTPEQPYHQQQQQHAALPAAHSPTPESKQYLRLPLDSAKKLRWYDKSDVASLTRQHVREKHLLLDTITALKKVMIRAGFTDAALDEEARQLVAAAEAMRLADHGTESVLLLAVQAELEEVSASRQQLQDELQQLQERMQELESQPAPSVQIAAADKQQQQLYSISSKGLDAAQQQEQLQEQQEQPHANGVAGPAEDTAVGKAASLLQELQGSYAALQAAVAAAADASAEVRVQELQIASAQQQQQQQEQPPSTAAAAPSTQQQDASSTPLQQQQPAAAAAEAAAPPADVVKRYREFTMQLEERCRAAERCASLSAARVASLEESLAAAQASLAAAQQRGAQAAAAARQQIAQLEERLRAAESAAAAAAATPNAAGGGGAAAVAAAAAADEQLAQLQQQLAASRTQVASLERRLAAAEGREASLMAQLRSAEAALAERDAALAAAAALREQLGESAREAGQLQHYKQRVAELEAGKAELEAQLGGLASLVASLEARLRDASAQSAAASAAAELAAAAAAKAQAAVAEQVAARLAAAGRNRALWPHAAQHEVEQLEQQLEALQAQMGSVTADLDSSVRQLQQEQQSQAELQHRLQEAEAALVQAEREASLRAAELQSSLECCQADTSSLREQLEQQQQQQQQQLQQQQQQQQALGRQGTVGSPNARGGAAQKWQAQNKVGGGSLYGVADSAVEAAARLPVGSCSQRDVVGGVDLVYVKNVVLKFLEAVMAGKAAERDALLPAVAAVLQATPAEFGAMRRVAAATAPPGTQVLGVLGRLANLAS
ncbi:hypothetical protein OEZ85_014171 [Tetradesmus obliquus]|uniref:GRIP domain-containing protein n=1 Tax=Tetradesmus obliquus TaxID=3088 RepID=A0ABY8U766_TETOB|nr:hypothetical protein OEZ85_014171 [Tetradesmus obliquus]